MNYLKLCMSLTIILVFSTSCDKEENKPTKRNSIFPVNMNNRWSYEEQRFSSRYGIQTDTFIFDIKYEHTINGIKGFAIGDYKTEIPISLLNNDNDGNCIEYFFDNNKLVFSSIAYKNKISKNEKWTYKSAVFTDDDYANYEIREIEKTCIAIDTIISTTIRDFNCIAHSYHPGGFDDNGNPYHTMVDFLSENIGIIKRLHYEHDNGVKKLFREEILIDYSISE